MNDVQFPAMHEIVPEGRFETAAIKHFDALGRRHARLLLGGGTMMTDSDFERATNAEVVRRAHGRVLIAGLGLGMILWPIAAKPNVTEIVVIERNVDVIALVGNHIPARVRVIAADIRHWHPAPGEKFNTIWFDISAMFSREMLKWEIENLFRPFLPFLASRTADRARWMGSWQVTATREQRRQRKMKGTKKMGDKKTIGGTVIDIIEGGTMRTGHARIFEALLDERIDERARAIIEPLLKPVVAEALKNIPGAKGAVAASAVRALDEHAARVGEPGIAPPRPWPPVATEVRRDTAPVAPSKLVIALDFDGVVHKSVTKWTTAHEVNDEPVEGAFDFIRGALDGGFGIILHTARARTITTVPHIYAWLREHGLEERYCWQIEATALKPAAHVYIDDNGYRFEGHWPSLDEIRALRQWNKPEAHSMKQHGPPIVSGVEVDAEKLSCSDERCERNGGTHPHPIEPRDGFSRAMNDLANSGHPAGTPFERKLYAELADLGAAVERAGFRVAPDFNGLNTLWCRKCGRDGGYHYNTCPKATTRPVLLDESVPIATPPEHDPGPGSLSMHGTAAQPPFAAPKTDAAPADRSGWVCTKGCGWADVSAHFERFDGEECPNCKAPIAFSTNVAPEKDLHHADVGARIPTCMRGKSKSLVDFLKTHVTSNWLQVTCAACKALQPEAQRPAAIGSNVEITPLDAGDDIGVTVNIRGGVGRVSCNPIPCDGKPRTVTCVIMNTHHYVSAFFKRTGGRVILGFGGAGETKSSGSFEVAANESIELVVECSSEAQDVEIKVYFANEGEGERDERTSNPWARRCAEISEILERKPGESHLQAAERVIIERNALINDCARLRATCEALSPVAPRDTASAVAGGKTWKVWCYHARAKVAGWLKAHGKMGEWATSEAAMQAFHTGAYTASMGPGWTFNVQQDPPEGDALI